MPESTEQASKPLRPWRPMAAWTAGRLVTSRKKMLVLVVTLLVIYVGSHLAISRYSASRLREADVECFLYVPCQVESLRDHRSLWWAHRVMMFVYAPLWAVDHHLLGGPAPMMSEPMWGLTPPADGEEPGK